MLEWQERVNINSLVCHGKACIRGTRVMVSVILDNLAAGVPREELLQSYPSIESERVVLIWLRRNEFSGHLPRKQPAG
jgi:uncharacterized protein (DUF433 family)